MKRMMVGLLLVGSMMFSLSASADDAEVGGEFRVGGTYAITPADENTPVLLHRYGFDADVGLFVDADSHLAMRYSIFLDAVMNTEQMYRFGFRFEFGGCNSVSNQLKDFHVLFAMGLAQMAISNNSEVMWTPEIGLDIKGSIFFVRPSFTGYVGSEMGYGFLLVAGFSFKKYFD